MHVLIAVIAGFLFTNQIGCHTDYLNTPHAIEISTFHLDKTSTVAAKQYKNKSGKRTKVAAIKYKRSKAKGLKKSEDLNSETLSPNLNDYPIHNTQIVEVRNASFLYCVKYKRGPPSTKIS